ncbi:methylesterase 10 [Solanum lycopersicum]|uniref:AB hydrolase-1 domain-containing protein n=1 Tax=Solanum lycopersicum TaxID=4081 RepID=A0A3Q7FJJ6_SOLLC|nr:methylesterase 10 [Solanum lycopersicum]
MEKIGGIKSFNMEKIPKKHFILVHGFCHGSWCWYKIINLLEKCGHKVTALDLGGCGINMKQLNEIDSIFDYIQPLMDLMISLSKDEKIILVSHSYGGLCISLAMEAFPHKISTGVFISAYMPNHVDPPSLLILEYFKRTSVESLMDCQFKFDQGMENPPTSAIFGPQYMQANLYKNCQPEDLELSKMLIRPGKFFIQDMSKEGLLTQEKYGSVKRVYIVTQDDQVMQEEFQMYNIHKSPPHEVKIIANSGHMVMISRPHELFLCLQEIIENSYN